MMPAGLDQIAVTPVRRIATPGGDVLHALKASEPSFHGFGEAYFSWVAPGAVKAWKYHTRMTLNLVVPVGTVRFVFHLPGPSPAYRCEEIGQERYLRLTVPPGIWFGFRGRGIRGSLLMNLANIEHEAQEALRKDVSEFDYDWGAL